MSSDQCTVYDRTGLCIVSMVCRSRLTSSFGHARPCPAKAVLQGTLWRMYAADTQSSTKKPAETGTGRRAGAAGATCAPGWGDKMAAAPAAPAPALLAIRTQPDRAS